MLNITKLNNKLKYEKYCNYSKDDWNNYKIYCNMSNSIVNTYDFINTFKDKLNFEFLFRYNKISKSLIEEFIDLYDVNAWKSLVNYNKHIFTVNFINKYYEKITYPVLTINHYVMLKLKKEAFLHLEQLIANKRELEMQIALDQQEYITNSNSILNQMLNLEEIITK